MTENPALEVSQFLKPQINLARSTAARMWLVNLCALMVIVQSSLSDSYSSLLIALSAVAAALLTEFLLLHKSGRAALIKDGSAVATALILTLLMPNRISPLFAAAGAVFAVAVVKHSFGGLGSNWLNPAAGGWLFVRFSWPAAFSQALEGSPLSLLAESVSRGAAAPEGSPLSILKIDAAGFLSSATSLDRILRPFLNRSVFALTGAELPGGYLDLFASRLPGIIADRGVFALILGAIIISAFQVNRSWIPAVYLAVFGVLVRAAGALPYGGEFGNGDVFFTVCSGGTLIAAFFLAMDPVTGTKSRRGAFLAAAAGGIIAFLFRCPGSEPYGAVFAALFVNAMLPLIRVVEIRWLYERREART